MLGTAPSRRDISQYVVHLTRDYNGTLARDNLLSILADLTIEARNPYGVAIAHLKLIGRATDAALKTQRVVCFSETPPDDLYGLINPGIWRRYKFRPYGVAFTREYALDHGANAVWYLNSYVGQIQHRWLAKDVNDLIDAVAIPGSAEEGGLAFAGSTIARLTPFMEVVGSWDTMKKDFTFEREWRRRDDFTFGAADVAAVIVPPGEIESIRLALGTLWDATRVAQLTFLELGEGQATGSS
jgi:hypothetical protein